MTNPKSMTGRFGIYYGFGTKSRFGIYYGFGTKSRFGIYYGFGTSHRFGICHEFHLIQFTLQHLLVTKPGIHDKSQIYDGYLIHDKS
jgi:hypothetical protein